MKRLATLGSGAVLFGMLMFGVGFWSGLPGPIGGMRLWSTGPTITHLESLSHLVATKVHVADVMTAEDQAFRGSWLIKGDALISIDLSRATIVESDPKSRTATLRLPQPVVMSARVDHELTKTWSVEKTTWLPFQGTGDAMRDQAMFHAQKLVERAAGSSRDKEYTRASAARLISGVYQMVEWQVTIEWESAEPEENGR